MKSKIKIILVFMLGITVSVFISVTAATIINSKDVSYDNTLTGLTANVQEAIDETYTKASSLDDRITALENGTTTDILDKIYPVGSIYISTELSTVEGVAEKLGGEWEAYAQGRTLISANSSYAAGSTGGSSEATLTAANLPNHTHTGSTTSTGAHTHSTTAKTVTISSGLTAQSAGSEHEHYVKIENAILAAGSKYARVDSTSSKVTSNAATDKSGAHTHTVTGSITIPALSITSSGTHNHNVSVSTCTNCSGTSFSTQDPYIAVYMYKRIN